MPKVSIIVPNYNHEGFLEKRLQSILDQSFQDWELIFVDDASTDKSLDIFRNIASDPRIREPLVNKTRSGNILSQWRKGIGSARGEYIWIAESDDYADKKFLQTTVGVLDSHKKAGIVYTASYLVDENGKVTGTKNAKYKNTAIMDGPAICSRELIFGNSIPNASAVLFRKSVYDNLRPVPEHSGFILSHDWFLWVQMLSVSDLVYVAEPLNYFRRHGDATSNVLGRSEQGVYEKALVMDYIARHITVDKRTLREAAQQLADEWMMRVLKYGRFFDRNKDIYRVAYKIYPGIGVLLFAGFFRFYAGKISHKSRMVMRHIKTG